MAPHLSSTIARTSWLSNSHFPTRSLAKEQPLPFVPGICSTFKDDLECVGISGDFGQFHSVAFQNNYAIRILQQATGDWCAEVERVTRLLAKTNDRYLNSKPVRLQHVVFPS